MAIIISIFKGQKFVISQVDKGQVIIVTGDTCQQQKLLGLSGQDTSNISNVTVTDLLCGIWKFWISSLDWIVLFYSRFRRQHEQLRAVIVRVLQPPAVSQATPTSPGGPPSAAEGEEAKPKALLDPADANAIEEVNLAYENVKEVDGLDVSKDGTEAWEGAVKRFVVLSGF